MSDILDRLKNLENAQPTVLRSANTVPSRSRNSSKKRVRVRAFLFCAIVLAASALVYQVKMRFYPSAPPDTVPMFDISQILEQRNQLALAAYQSSDYKKAQELFEKLVADKPEQSEFHVNLAMAFAKDSNFDKAMQHLETAIKLDPKNSFAFNNLGLVALQTKQFDLARKSFEKAVELNPTSSELKLNLASFYEKTGKLTKSVETYQEFIRLPASNQASVELVKKRLPRLNSLSAKFEDEEEEP